MSFQEFKESVLNEALLGESSFISNPQQSDLSKVSTKTLQSHHALFSNAKSGSKEHETLKRIHGELEKRGQKLPPLKENELDEAKKDTSIIHHPTYSSAVQHAQAQANAKGYTVPEDEWHDKITVGPGKPKGGATTRHTLRLEKDGKPSKKGLHIQVYNRETDQNPYELNHYIS
jgi:hypothetical protein